MTVDLGDVPGWLSAIATVAATGLAVVVLLRERSARKEADAKADEAHEMAKVEQARRQAEGVTWWTRVTAEGEVVLEINNASPQVAYNADLMLLPAAFSDLPEADLFVHSVGVLPPGRSTFLTGHFAKYLPDPEVTRSSASGFASDLIFYDAKQHRWMRAEDGELIDSGIEEPRAHWRRRFKEGQGTQDA